MLKKEVEIEEVIIKGVTYVPKDSQASTVIEVDGGECPYEIGKAYLIRTVTMIQVGRVKKVTSRALILEQASWVADTGRFNEALRTGKLNEVEPFKNDAIVHFGGIIDATEWDNELPNTVK